MKKLILYVVFLFAALCCFSQAPQKFSYQSVIRSSGNQLVSNQTVGIKISVLQGSANGAAVYSETHSPLTNANGLATLEIGGGVVLSGNFANINWASGPYFIKTETDANGGNSYTISATQQLLSVPYALYAASSGSSLPGPQGPAGPQGEAGPQGPSGIDGVSISGISINDDNLIITLSNGATQSLQLNINSISKDLRSLLYTTDGF